MSENFNSQVKVYRSGKVAFLGEDDIGFGCSGTTQSIKIVAEFVVLRELPHIERELLSGFHVV